MQIEKKRFIAPRAELILLLSEDIITSSLENAGVAGEIENDNNPEYFPF